MRKQLIRQLAVYLLFFIGLLTMLYPFYVNAINNYLDQRRMSVMLKNNQKDFERSKEMNKVNEQLKESNLQLQDPFTEEHLSKKTASYYQKHLIGRINIPKLALDIPLYDITNNELMEQGATVLQGTSFPIGGENTHSVISGHRGLPKRELFTNLPNLEEGDFFILEVLGKKLAYKVQNIQVVEPSDTEVLKIVPQKDLVTLLTCTPYMINSHRLLVTGERTPYTKNVKKQEQQGNSWRYWQQCSIILGMFLLILGFSLLIYRKILKYQIRNYRIDLKIWIDQDQVLTLYDKKGKKKQYRNEKIYQLRPSSDGSVIFENLPGDVYVIKSGEEWVAQLGIKKKKQKISVFKINSSYTYQKILTGYQFTKK